MARRRVTRNVHVYIVGDEFYIPMVVKEANGTWVEVLPVASGPARDREALAQALEGARAGNGLIAEGQAPWDGDNGRVWDSAKHFLTLYWLDDGTLKIAPKVNLPVKTDPETGDILAGGWVDDKRRVRPLPGDMPMTTVATTLLNLIAEGHNG